MPDTPAPPAVSRDFDRGARAAAESMRFYFLDEDERSLHADLSAEVLEQHETRAVADALCDERRRVERLGERGPVVVPSAYRVLPTGYASATLADKYHFELQVQWRGQDEESGLNRWGWRRGVLFSSEEGGGNKGPWPSSCDDDFLHRFRFPLDQALRLATEAVDSVKLNGRTLAQWEERLAASDVSEQPDGAAGRR